MATVKSTQRRDLEKDIICSAGWCLAGAHLGGIWEHLGSIWEASGGGIRRHLGSILGSIRKHLGIILGASGYIWKHLEAYGNIWEASGSICKASGGIWEPPGLLDGASPEESVASQSKILSSLLCSQQDMDRHCVRPIDTIPIIMPPIP